MRKIPVTILSRCQRFDLKREALNNLKIKKNRGKENGKISDQAIKLIASN